MKKTVTISKSKHFECQDALFYNWYNCDNCGSADVKDNEQYCSHCGTKIKWVD